jgi:hypothetical protein
MEDAMTVLRTTACATLLLIAGVAHAATNPWFGTWKLRAADAGDKPETLIYSDAGGGAMRMESVEENSVLVTRFDGKPAADVGKAADQKRALAITAISFTSYRWVFSIDGAPRVEGLNTLAPDGRSFTEVSWRPARPADTITLVYERQ